QAAHMGLDAELPGYRHGGLQQGEVRDGGEGAAQAELVGVVGVRAGALAEHHVPHLQLGGDGTGAAHPDDVVHIIEVEQLMGVNADGGHPHAGGHDGHRRALIGAGVALDAPDVVHQLRVLQKGLRDEFGPQRIAGHQNGLGKGPLGRLVMGSSHAFISSLFLFHGLHGLDDAAGAQAGGTQVDEVLRVLQVGDTAGGLDLHVGAHVLGEKGHVLPGGAAGAEACGGLDILRAGG
ncbi:Large polyvalent protein associated domain-containing protein, partial [Dysosmobacter welbionis]